MSPDIDKLDDADKLIAWLREAAFELENAHRVLDGEDVPRRGEVPYTLAARIALLADRHTEPPTEGDS